MTASKPAQNLPQTASGTPGRDALLVFFGTLAVAATGLVAAVVMAPGRFGLGAGGPDPSPNRGAASAEGSAGTSPGSSIGNPTGGGPGARAAGGEGGPSDSFRYPAAAEIGALDSGLWSSGDGAASGWDRAGEVPFLVPRGIADGDPGARRQTVPRSPAPDPVGNVIFADAEASVVHVTTLALRQKDFAMTESVAGTGSGMVWDRHGHIVTSRHVIEGAARANVLFSDGRGLSAKLVGVDYPTDIAVLRVDVPARSLTPIRVGTSFDLRVGMRAFSVACPYGLRHSLASGLISGLDRTIRLTTAEKLDGTIQTDTSVQPGCSGGALIDDQGRVVGMNAAIHWDSQNAPGVGFAVPIDLLQDIVPRIIRDGYRWHRDFGFVTAAAKQSEQFLERARGQSTSTALPGGASAGTPLGQTQGPFLPEFGLVVMEVDPETSAAAAGLRGTLQVRRPRGSRTNYVRDIVVTAGGQPVRDSDDIQAAIDQLRPGEPLELGIARRGGVVSMVLPRGKP